MSNPKLNNSAAGVTPIENRRRSGRLRCEAVRCSMGEVIDISAGGMRVFRRNRPGAHAGDTVTVTLDAMGHQIKAPVRICRVDCQGLFKVEIGLEFTQLTPELRATLNEIARSVSTNSVFLHSQNATRAA